MPITFNEVEVPAARLTLKPENCALVVVDIQEKLLPPIFNREQLVRNAQLLIRLARLLDLPIAPHSTQLRALTRQAVNAIVEIKDRHRYLRALTPYIGYETRTVAYQPISRSGRPPRESLVDAADAAIALIVGNSTRPLRIVSWLALLAAFLNVLYIGYVFAVRIFKTRVAEGWMTLSLQNAGMFLLLFLILAVVTEYIGRILDETRERPLYYIAEEANSSVMVPSAERRNVVRESR